MIVRVLPEAESELTMAANWYEDRDGGVGSRLLNAYELTGRMIHVRCCIA